METIKKELRDRLEYYNNMNSVIVPSFYLIIRENFKLEGLKSAGFFENFYNKGIKSKLAGLTTNNDINL